VRQIVRLDDAVGVVADHMGAAKKGLAALVIEWDDGPHAKLGTKNVLTELEQATPSRVWSRRTSVMSTRRCRVR
jgi:isoquinoline 1-oxidoreductase beta subunit